MTRAGFFGIIVAILLGFGWLKFIHDPAVRARARLDARGAVVDSMARAWQDTVQNTVKRDSVRRDSLVREVARQRRRKDSVRVHTDVLVETVEDTVVRAQLAAALREERERVDSLDRASKALEGLLRSQIAARDRLLGEARVIIDSLTVLRDTWRKEAGRFPVGVGCTVGPVVATTGLAPAGVACGVTVRF